MMTTTLGRRELKEEDFSFSGDCFLGVKASKCNPLPYTSLTTTT